MADGLSRSTNGRRIGVIAVQALAGAENAFAGIAHSYTDSTPTLFLPGHPGIDLIGQRPTFDSVANYGATTKLAARVLTPDLLVPTMRQAFAALRSGRPQPVMVELVEDALVGEVSGDVAEYTPVPWIGPDPTRAASARRPTCCSARRRRSSGRVTASSTPRRAPSSRRSRSSWARPVLTTLMGKSGFDEGHELSVGTGGYSESPVLRHFLEAADTLLAVGSSLSRTSFAPSFGPGKTHHPRHQRSARPVQGPPHGRRPAQRREAVPGGAGGGTARSRRRGRARASGGDRRDDPRAAGAHSWPSTRRCSPPRARPSRATGCSGSSGRCSIPSRTILTHESGHSRDIQSVFWPARTPRSYLAWGHSTQLGFSLGLAMGTKLAHPDKLVVNVMGDAARRHDRHGLGRRPSASGSRSSRSSSTTRSSRCTTSTSRSRSSGSAHRTSMATTRASPGRWAAMPSA